MALPLGQEFGLPLSYVVMVIFGLAIAYDIVTAIINYLGLASLLWVLFATFFILLRAKAISMLDGSVHVLNRSNNISRTPVLGCLCLRGIPSGSINQWEL